jgi:hypothetical protein
MGVRSQEQTMARCMFNCTTRLLILTFIAINELLEVNRRTLARVDRLIDVVQQRTEPDTLFFTHSTVNL